MIDNVTTDGTFNFGNGDVYPMPENLINLTWGYQHQCCWKSAREQVQDEILAKMAEAVSNNDLKKAKELVLLAKKLKEL